MLRSDGSIQRCVVGTGGGGRSRESCVTRSWNWQALDAEFRGIDRQDVWQVHCYVGFGGEGVTKNGKRATK